MHINQYSMNINVMELTQELNFIHCPEQLKNKQFIKQVQQSIETIHKKVTQTSRDKINN